jgi:2-hydroxy-6-oxonona-2,4-dienedioate hydrolase
MLSRRDHLDNFVKSLEANPKQFPDFSPRLGEIRAQTLIVWGATTALCRWTPGCACCRD